MFKGPEKAFGQFVQEHGDAGGTGTGTIETIPISII